MVNQDDESNDKQEKTVERMKDYRYQYGIKLEGKIKNKIKHLEEQERLALKQRDNLKEKLDIINKKIDRIQGALITLEDLVDDA